jgi:aminoglycoside phosphotransferase (APT) family kinase protein
VHGSTLDDSYVGGPFFISDRIEGETIPRRVLRQAAALGHGDHVVGQIGAALARLHAIDPAKAPTALVVPPANAPVAAALAGLELAIDGLLKPEPAFAYGLRWLRRHRPTEPARLTIIHTDVRNGNIIVGPDGLRAILDWEGSRLGDPMEDVAWPQTRMWRFGEDANILGGLAGVEPYRAGYESAGGTWDAPRIQWWRALTTLRWGTGLAGQSAAHLDGRFRSIIMAGSGRRVSELAWDALLLMRP